MSPHSFASPERVMQPMSAGAILDRVIHVANIGTTTHRQDTFHDIAASYQYCSQLTRYHSKSFFLSTQFLPPHKRRAIRALYAFCRISDDLVDHGHAIAFASWLAGVRNLCPPYQHPILPAWADTCQSYGLSAELVDELLAGVAMDLSTNRYATFDDLWVYCYRVASVVGLLSMHILGFEPGAEPYAIKLGVALQLTNILRDVGEDARSGRIYLPLEDLARFGLTTYDILHRPNDQRFQKLMAYQIDRAHRLYDESWEGIALLSADSRFAVGAAARIYRGILPKIEANNYDVYTRRAHVPLAEKLLLLPGIWRAVGRLSQR